MTTKHGITVGSYVQTADGLVNFDDLAPEQKTKAATQLKASYLNAMYAGRAVFTAEERESK